MPLVSKYRFTACRASVPRRARWAHSGIGMFWPSRSGNYESAPWVGSHHNPHRPGTVSLVVLYLYKHSNYKLVENMLSFCRSGIHCEAILPSSKRKPCYKPQCRQCQPILAVKHKATSLPPPFPFLRPVPLGPQPPHAPRSSTTARPAAP